jgi:glycosyltransferase involved in cell wall biosynthesis
LKILYHHRIASKDGQYVHLRELVDALERAGHEIILAGPKIVDSADFGNEGGLVRSLKNVLPRFMYESLEFGYSLVSWRRLRRLAKQHRPDIIYERFNLFSPAGTWVGKQLGIPLILEVNAPLYEEREEYGGISLERLARWSQAYVWRNADAVLPVTSVLARLVTKSGVPRDAVTVFHNGVVLDRYDGTHRRSALRERFGVSGSVVLGFVGFIREWHRLDYIIEAMRDPALANTKLLVVGEGPARESLQQQARDAGLASRVVFAGLVSRSGLIDMLGAFDVALQPHVVSYASPLKLFEYMAMGLPIIAPDTANIREVLTHDKDSLLVPVADRAAVHDALLQLASDAGLRARLGQAARARITSGGYTWDNNAKRVAAIAADLCGRH